MMDQIEEKKWFVFLGDHHEGPFSISEIQPKLENKQIGTSHFVWAEGMPDWVPIHEIEAFSQLKTKNLKTQEIPAPKDPAPNPALIFEEPKFDASALSKSFEIPELNDPEPDFRGKPDVSGLDVRKKIPVKTRSSLSSVLRLVFGMILLGCFTYGALMAYDQSGTWMEKLRPLLNDQIISLLESHPNLGSLISPIPHLKGVNNEDNDALKAAADTSLGRSGPSLAVGVSKENLNSPVFYVASNLPDGTKFEIYVEGVRETLLNRLSSDTHLSVVLDHRLAMTPPVVFDGKTLVPGEYRISVTESEAQPAAVRALLSKLQPLNAEKTEHLPAGIKLLARKAYFLGGTKDMAYNQKLRDYHESLKQKARLEIEELKQFVTQLESQMNTTIAQFNMFRKTHSPTKKKNWFPFDEFWRKQEAPLNDTFSKWSPELLKADYVYGPMYLSAQQAGQTVQKLHELQKDYFDKKLDEKAVDIQVGETQAAAQGMILALKTKFDEIEKATPPASGLPAGI